MIVLTQAEQLLSNHEYTLEEAQRAATTPCSVEVAEEALKKHETFMSAMAGADERVEVVLSQAEVLSDPVVYPADRVKDRANRIKERRDKNKEDAQLVTVMLQVSYVVILL